MSSDRTRRVMWLCPSCGRVTTRTRMAAEDLWTCSECGAKWRRGYLLEVGEGKKGRVICAWCKGDMGEAETELDTHTCCLKCLRLALRELDERLSASRLAQEARQRARERGRPATKKVWRVGDPPVNLSVVYGPLGMVGTSFLCPGCGENVTVEDSGEDLFYHCGCGAHLHLRIEPGLAELL